MTSSEPTDMTGAFPAAPQPVPDATAFPAPLPPQATAEADPYAPSSAWSNPFEDFTTPSGQRCLLRKLDLPHLIEAGLLEQFDSLGGIVESELIRPAQGQPPVDTRKAIQNPATMRALIPMMEKILRLAVVRPELQDPPAKGEPRLPGVAYLDAVSLTDKLAIFNRAAGDLEDLKSLRPKSN